MGPLATARPPAGAGHRRAARRVARTGQARALGSFNRRGQPVGFHHAPNGVCPPGRRIDEVLERFPDGSYRARVSLWHPECGWVQKRRASTMFADGWTSEHVMQTGLDAYRNRTEDWVVRWRCRSSTPRIAGFHRRRSGPTTFFPGYSEARGSSSGRALPPSPEVSRFRSTASSPR
ncbi:MAG: EndoU domain-containing protein [Candidatus Dormibacteraceae bacterium]